MRILLLCEGYMRNRYEAQRYLKGTPEDIRSAVRYALQRTPRKNVNWTDNEISFSVPMSSWSWGEKVVIYLEDNGKVMVFSNCSIGEERTRETLRPSWT